MGAFLLLTSAEGWLPTGSNGAPDPLWYPIAYSLKVIVVAALLVWFRSAWRDFRPVPRGMAPWVVAVLTGLGVIVVWVGLDLLAVRLGYTSLYPRLGGVAARRAFDPLVLSPWPRVAFLAIRFVGLVLLVPVFEELFWRSFLMRMVIDPDDFRRVPVGQVTLLAAGITSAAFAAVHPEWLPALLTGLAWSGLLHWTRSLSACLVSHAVANLALGVYVLVTGEWRYW